MTLNLGSSVLGSKAIEPLSFLPIEDHLPSFYGWAQSSKRRELSYLSLAKIRRARAWTPKFNNYSISL